MTQLNRLLARPLRPANHVMRTLPLQPEMRRIIGHIRQDRYERNARQRALRRLKKRAIEIRHQRNHHVRFRSTLQ